MLYAPMRKIASAHLTKVRRKLSDLVQLESTPGGNGRAMLRRRRTRLPGAQCSGCRPAPGAVRALAGRSVKAPTTLSRTTSASLVPSASPFSKSSPDRPIVLVTCARQNPHARRPREGIKSSSFHFDRKNALVLRGFDGFRCVHRNGASVVQRRSDNAARLLRGHCFRRRRNQLQGVGVREFGRRRVMIARPFISQRAINDHEIRRRSGWHNLSGRSKTDRRRRQPLANSSSATSTAKDDPTTPPMIFRLPVRRARSNPTRYDSRASLQIASFFLSREAFGPDHHPGPGCRRLALRQLQVFFAAAPLATKRKAQRLMAKRCAYCLV